MEAWENKDIWRGKWFGFAVVRGTIASLCIIEMDALIFMTMEVRTQS